MVLPLLPHLGKSFCFDFWMLALLLDFDLSGGSE
jgi:hypothetical protein